LYFLKSTDALCPPKPKVLLKAALTTLFCDLPMVKFNFGSMFSSGVEWLIVGGISSLTTAKIDAIDSMAPAAPNQ